MDPNANLAEQLRLANQIVDGDFDAMDDTTAERLAELVIALDQWLTNRGFLPKAWERKTQRGHEHPLDMPCVPPCQMTTHKD